MADTLQDHLTDVRRLLHDALGDIWSDYDLSAYINRARNRVATDTGVLRSLIKPYSQASTEVLPWGGVTAIIVSAAGTGYTSAPTVALSTGSGATAGTITFSSGAIATIPVSAGGSGYTDPPTVTISGNGSGASAHAVISAGVVTSIVVDYGGTGYTSATATLAAIGSGATATATVSGGAVTGVTVTNAGTGYWSAPAVSFSGGGGSSAAATAYIIPSNTVDVINATVIWNNQRIPMRNFAFTELSAYGRPWTTYTYTPGAFAVYGKSLYVAPLPNDVYQYEFDTVYLPSPLYGTDTGPFIDPEIEAVKYWAAYLAKLQTGQSQDAQEFKGQYYDNIQWAVNVYTRRGQSVYYNNANVRSE